MMIALHKNAPTTLAIRAEMVTTLETAVALALCDSVSQSTNDKRKSLARFNVTSHIPQRLQTTFTSTQQQIVVVLRKILLLRFDDLLAVSRKFLSLQDTSSGLVCEPTVLFRDSRGAFSMLSKPIASPVVKIWSKRTFATWFCTNINYFINRARVKLRCRP